MIRPLTAPTTSRRPRPEGPADRHLLIGEVPRSSTGAPSVGRGLRVETPTGRRSVASRPRPRAPERLRRPVGVRAPSIAGRSVLEPAPLVGSRDVRLTLRGRRVLASVVALIMVVALGLLVAVLTGRLAHVGSSGAVAAARQARPVDGTDASPGRWEPGSGAAGIGSGSGSAGGEHQSMAVGTARQVVVAPGDTLWRVAERVRPGHDPRPIVAELAQANQIRSAALVPGQVLVVPEAVGD